MFRAISALAFVVAAFLLPSSATAQTPTPQTRLWDAAIAGDTAALAARTGFTALHHAAESGSIEALETLLAAGADPAAPNTLIVAQSASSPKTRMYPLGSRTSNSQSP
jgi:ankyrin repeat protein